MRILYQLTIPFYLKDVNVYYVLNFFWLAQPNLMYDTKINLNIILNIIKIIFLIHVKCIQLLMVIIKGYEIFLALHILSNFVDCTIFYRLFYHLAC